MKSRMQKITLLSEMVSSGCGVKYFFKKPIVISIILSLNSVHQGSNLFNKQKMRATHFWASMQMGRLKKLFDKSRTLQKILATCNLFYYTSTQKKNPTRTAIWYFLQQRVCNHQQITFLRTRQIFKFLFFVTGILLIHYLLIFLINQECI